MPNNSNVIDELSNAAVLAQILGMEPEPASVTPEVIPGTACATPLAHLDHPHYCAWINLNNYRLNSQTYQDMFTTVLATMNDQSYLAATPGIYSSPASHIPPDAIYHLTPTVIADSAYVAAIARLSYNEQRFFDVGIAQGVAGRYLLNLFKQSSTPVQITLLLEHIHNELSSCAVLSRAVGAVKSLDNKILPRAVFDLRYGSLRYYEPETLTAYMENLDSCGCTDVQEAKEHINEILDLADCSQCGHQDGDSYLWDVWSREERHRICRTCQGAAHSYSDYYEQWVENAHQIVAYNANGHAVVADDRDDDFEYDECNDRYVHIDLPEDFFDDDDDGGSQVIRDYHSSKNKVKLQHDAWTKQHSRFLGVELEVECSEGSSRESAAEEIHVIVNKGHSVGYRMFFETDGSLDYGFEMISQPMSLPAHRELWAFLKDKDNLEGLRSHNTSTCGLHVHVSRKGMSSLQIAKMVAFVNDPDNTALIEGVARRGATSYCKIQKKNKVSEYLQSEGRYEAVNIRNSRTIELRIFRGTLKYESVIAAIEFSNALVEFCKLGNASIRDLTTAKFMEFIKTKLPAETKLLRAYLAHRLGDK